MRPAALNQQRSRLNISLQMATTGPGMSLNGLLSGKQAKAKIEGCRSPIIGGKTKQGGVQLDGHFLEQFEAYRRRSRFHVKFEAEEMYINQVRSFSPVEIKETLGDFQLKIKQSQFKTLVPYQKSHSPMNKEECQQQPQQKRSKPCKQLAESPSIFKSKIRLGTNFIQKVSSTQKDFPIEHAITGYNLKPALSPTNQLKQPLERKADHSSLIIPGSDLLRETTLAMQTLPSLTIAQQPIHNTTLSLDSGEAINQEIQTVDMLSIGYQDSNIDGLANMVDTLITSEQLLDDATFLTEYQQNLQENTLVQTPMEPLPIPRKSLLFEFSPRASDEVYQQSITMRRSVFKRQKPTTLTHSPKFAQVPEYVDPKVQRERKIQEIREAMKLKKLESIGQEIEKYKVQKLQKEESLQRLREVNHRKHGQRMQQRSPFQGGATVMNQESSHNFFTISSSRFLKKGSVFGGNSNRNINPSFAQSSSLSGGMQVVSQKLQNPLLTSKDRTPLANLTSEVQLDYSSVKKSIADKSRQPLQIYEIKGLVPKHMNASFESMRSSARQLTDWANGQPIEKNEIESPNPLKSPDSLHTLIMVGSRNAITHNNSEPDILKPKNYNTIDSPDLAQYN
ncbi:hypothetical protein FGO68_gene5170 [Halteria grandinella]|uniref:Uncharacterized protein n=1 Tax=Halteria grandinella TaxID=5974 RepID=A0A8J8T8J7_HALGN|nr:hypothetical protein FGO68_gene5170 [Halteria grandinella]